MEPDTELELHADADSETTSQPIIVDPSSYWGALTTSKITHRVRFSVVHGAVGDVLVTGGTYSAYVYSTFVF